MDKYTLFKEFVANAANEFISILTTDKNNNSNKNKTINTKIISHLDSDGISAAAIAIKASNELNLKSDLSIVKQLDTLTLNKLLENKNEFDYYIFTDVGASKLKYLSENLSNKKILILDHHIAESNNKYDNIIHVNPVLFGIDGSKEISGAGVSYLFFKNILEGFKQNAHIAIIGAMGDSQEHKGFKPLNNEILQDAIEFGYMDQIKDLKLFGKHSRPVTKLLEYSTNPHIPGVTNNRDGTIKFLEKLEINYRTDIRIKKIFELTDDEIQRITDGIIKQRRYEEKPEDVFGFTYILKNESQNSPLREAKEFSTVLNACGRMNNPVLGVNACLGNPEAKQECEKILHEYKKEIVTLLNWYKSNQNSEDFHKGKNFILINAKDNIDTKLTGTFTSIVSHNNYRTKIKYVVVMSRDSEKHTKISFRFAQKKLENENVSELLTEMTQGISKEIGGHRRAAGGIIPIDKETEFVKNALSILNNVN